MMGAKAARQVQAINRCFDRLKNPESKLLAKAQGHVDSWDSWYPWLQCLQGGLGRVQGSDGFYASFWKFVVTTRDPNDLL